MKHSVDSIATRTIFICPVVFLFWAMSAPVVSAQGSAPAATEVSPVYQQMIVENQTGYDVDVLYKKGAEFVVHATIPQGQEMVQPVTPGFEWTFGAGGSAIISTYTTTNAPQQRILLNVSMVVAAGLPIVIEAQAAPAGSLLPLQLPPPQFRKGPDVENDIPPKPVFDPAIVASELDPILGPLVDWYKFSEDAFAILDNAGGFLTSTDDGRLTSRQFPRGTTADTKSAWIRTQVEGKKDVYRISNVYLYDQYLFVDTPSFAGSPVLLGTKGQEGTAGEWKLDKGSYFHTLTNMAFPTLKIGVRQGKVALSSVIHGAGETPAVAESMTRNAGDSFHLFTSRNALDLENLLPSIVQMTDNLKRMDQQVADRAAAIEKKKSDIARHEAERRKIAAIPKVYREAGSISSRMGVGEIFDGENGETAIRYKFSDSGSAEILTFDLNTSPDPAKTQYADLVINPEVSAWVKDGDLFIAVKTDSQTSINLRHGDIPSSNFPTDGNFYVGNARVNLRLDEGREIMWSPTVQNKQVSFGTSVDQSSGFNLSAEEIVGADFSKSTGSNVNFDAREYEVSGIRGPGPGVIGSLQYTWDSCGLADKPKTDEPCTYTRPVDLYDETTNTLRKIPLIAQSLSGLETVTVFKNRFPKQGLSSNIQLRMLVDVQFHSVKIVPKSLSDAASENTSKFALGFTYIFQPQLWDLDKPLEEQTVIKAALQMPIGMTQNRSYNITMHINADDLKPFMTAGSK